MLHYILQTVIFQLVFLLIYDLFLKKETFFNWNRFYLLASALLSVVLPFIKIDTFKTVMPKEYVYALPELIMGNQNNNAIVTNEAIVNNINRSSLTFNWNYVLYIGCAVALLLFVIKLYRLVAIAYKNPKIKIEKAVLIELANSKHAFSFFNYIFLGKDINTEDRQNILAHELQHVKEKHSIDLLFFEILKIVFWLNPLIYLYQNRIANLHEFIADSKAVKSSSKVSYYQNLLSQVFDTKKVSFINPFFKQSLIKKRIIMLSKSKSKQIHLAKYLLLFPMVIGMLFYTSCETQVETPTEENSKLSEDELVKKYINEIRLLEKENKLYSNENEGYKKIMSMENNNYLYTLNEYARFKAFMIVMYEEVESSKDSMKDLEKSKIKIDDLHNKNYESYLERKKTQESIDQWENSPRQYQLRKHVKDLDNITVEEQKLIDSQVVQINNDDFLHTQIISDGLRHKKIEFENHSNIEKVEGEQISFAVLKEVPIYPGCDTSASKESKRECFSQNINKIVAKNFNSKLGKSLGLIGKQRIYVRFTINKQGNIVNVKTRAPHPELEKEARRVIAQIPQVETGKQEGKPVNVVFDLPITLNIQE